MTLEEEEDMLKQGLLSGPLDKRGSGYAESEDSAGGSQESTGQRIGTKSGNSKAQEGGETGTEKRTVG